MTAPTTDHMAIWNALSVTDKKHTKPFKRAGGFSGTATKPIYQIQKMTDLFGPCGIGWGYGEPAYQLVNGENREVLVFCWLSLWVVDPSTGQRSEPIPGVGGDKVVGYVKPNEQYKRPERWENDDEAFKKAFTDALGNAMKHIGMSADVHMGQFDGSKYQADDRDESPAPREPAPASRRPEPPRAVPNRPEQSSVNIAPNAGDLARKLADTIYATQTSRDLDEIVADPDFKRQRSSLPDAAKTLVDDAGKRQRQKLSEAA